MVDEKVDALVARKVVHLAAMKDERLVGEMVVLLDECSVDWWERLKAEKSVGLKGLMLAVRWAMMTVV